jgi:hypothetical protein
VTIDNLAIDIVRLAVNIRLEVSIVIEMKLRSVQLKRLANGNLRSPRQTPDQPLMTHIARREVLIDREQFVGIQCASAVPGKLRL